MVVKQCTIALLKTTTTTTIKTLYMCSTVHTDRVYVLLANDAYQVIVAVVADKRPAAVACAVCPSRVGTGVTHQVPISLREERGCKHTCQ